VKFVGQFAIRNDETRIAIDFAFRDTDGKAGINFVDWQWPRGWKGTGEPHGLVFSRQSSEGAHRFTYGRFQLPIIRRCVANTAIRFQIIQRAIRQA
jgi:hypothetical protein